MIENAMRRNFKKYRYSIEDAAKDIVKKQSKKINKLEKRKAGTDRDSHNRAYIVTKIRKYMKEGMEENEAIERVLQEDKEVVAGFKYMENAGLDLKVIFHNWIFSRSDREVYEPFKEENEEEHDGDDER